MRDEQLRKNKQAYLYGQISWLAILIASIIPIWQEGGLSFSEILFLQGLFALILLILEVPTGVIADAIERRKVIILGYISIIIGFCIYARSYDFWGFLLGESLFALGMSMLSGSEDAMLWDSYQSSTHKDEVNKIIADGRMIVTASAAVMMISGGLIASFDIRAPFYVGAACSVLNIVLYIRSEEPERKKLESPKLIWIKSLGSLKDKQFIKILIMFSTVSVMLRIAFWAYIPKLQEQGLTPIWFGILLAGANIIASLSIMFMRKREEIKYREVLLVYFVMGTGLVIFIPKTSLVILLFSILCHQIGRGVISVVSAVRINQIAESDVRASVGSLMSMLGSLFYVVSTITVDLLQLSMYAILIVNATTFLVFAIIWMVIDLSDKTIAPQIKASPITNP